MHNLLDYTTLQKKMFYIYLFFCVFSVRSKNILNYDKNYIPL